MFTPIKPSVMIHMKTLGPIILIEDTENPFKTIQEKYKILYKYQQYGKTLVRMPICRCDIINSKNSFLFSNLEFDEGAPKDTDLKYMFVQLVLERLEEHVKEYKKKSIMISTNIEMLPELFLEYGYKIISGRTIVDCKFMGMKSIEKGRTDYKMENLMNLKKDNT